MRLFLAVLALSLAACLVWWMLPGPRPTAPALEAPGATPAAVSERATSVLESEADDSLRSFAGDAEATDTKNEAEPTVAEFIVVGRVVDENREPLAGAQVRVSTSQPATGGTNPARPEPREDVARSSNDGSFRIAGLLPSSGRTLLFAEAGPYREQHARNLSRDVADHPLVAGLNDVGDIVLRAGGAITGRIVGNGVPIAEAAIQATQRVPESRTSRVTTRADGTFVIPGFAPGTATLEISARALVSLSRAIDGIELERTLALGDLELTAASRIAGVIVDPAGLPVAGANVVGNGQGGFQARAQSDERGRFELHLQVERPYWLSIDTGGRFEPWGGQMALECKFAPGTNDARIVLTPRAPMTFRVVSARSGAPIERFGLALVEQPARNTPDGRPVAEPPVEAHARGEVALPAFESKQHVRVVATGYASFGGPVQADASGAHVQTICLRAEGRLRGRVVRAEGTSGAAFVLLSAAYLGGATPTTTAAKVSTSQASNYDLDAFTGRSRRASCAPDGSFRFSELDPGTYRLFARADGCVSGVLDHIMIVEGEEKDVGDVRLQRGAIVRGRLDTGAARRIGWGVALDGGLFVRIAAEDGRFEIVDVAPGLHSISWSRPQTIGLALPPTDGAQQRSLLFQIANGETKELELDAKAVAPCRVRVRVVVDGAPAGNADVRFQWRTIGTHDWHNSNPPRTTADGRTEIEMAGNLELSCTTYALQDSPKPSWRLLGTSPTTTLSPGGTVDLEMRPQTGELVLRFADDFVLPKQGDYGVTLVSADGSSTSRTGSSEDFTHPPAPGDRTSKRVSLGWFAAGDYVANVSVNGISLGGNGVRRSEPVLPPREFHVTIRVDETTEIDLR